MSEISKKDTLSLFEGIQYGKNQYLSVLNNLDEYRIGLEAELVVPDDSKPLVEHLSKVEKVIRDLDYEVYFKVEKEGSDMVEIISKDVGGNGLSGSDIKDAYEGIFEIIDSLKKIGYYSRDSSDSEQGTGIHVSISMPNYEGVVDPVKFLMVSNILELLPKNDKYIRKYVSDIRLAFKSKKSIQMLVGSLISQKFKNKEPLSKDYDKILLAWAKSVVDINEKFQTVNFKNMNVQQGRIEIRMFGGMNYESMSKEIWDESIRSMYALKVAGSEEYGKREYLKILNRVANNALKDVIGMDISEYYVTLSKYYKLFNSIIPNFQDTIDLASVNFYRSLMSANDEYIKRIVLNNPEMVLNYLLTAMWNMDVDDFVIDVFKNLFINNQNLHPFKDFEHGIFIPDKNRILGFVKHINDRIVVNYGKIQL